MGAPESAQNSKCGHIQTQHDFPNALCEGEVFFSKGRSQIILEIPKLLCEGEMLLRQRQMILEMSFQIIFEIVFVKFGKNVVKLMQGPHVETKRPY